MKVNGNTVDVTKHKKIENFMPINNIHQPGIINLN